MSFRRPLFCLACLCLSGWLTACQTSPPPEAPLTTGFSCDVSATCNDMSVEGHLCRGAAGTLVLELTSPPTLNGLSLSWDGEDVTLGIHGLQVEVQPDTVRQSALGKALLNVLDTVQGFHSTDINDDNRLSTKGSSINGEFELLSDPDTGALLSLRIPSLPLTATFSHFVAE